MFAAPAPPAGAVRRGPHSAGLRESHRQRHQVFAPASAIEVQAEAATEVPSGAPSGFRRPRFAPAENGTYALVSIFDSGPGVPDADKKKIFEKFHQVKLG